MKYLKNNGLLDNLWGSQNVSHKRWILGRRQQLSTADTAECSRWYSNNKRAQHQQGGWIIDLMGWGKEATEVREPSSLARTKVREIQQNRRRLPASFLTTSARGWRRWLGRGSSLKNCPSCRGQPAGLQVSSLKAAQLTSQCFHFPARRSSRSPRCRQSCWPKLQRPAWREVKHSAAVFLPDRCGGSGAVWGYLWVEIWTQGGQVGQNHHTLFWRQLCKSHGRDNASTQERQSRRATIIYARVYYEYQQWSWSYQENSENVHCRTREINIKNVRHVKFQHILANTKYLTMNKQQVACNNHFLHF